MSDNSKEFPSVENLEAVAWLCLEGAAMTDLDQFPPGSGMSSARRLHARKRQFEEAAVRLKAGTGIRELGLSFTDFAWAASMAYRAIDKEGWRRRFEAAADEMKEPESVEGG
ncbi:MAG: hypothetical protein V2A55_00935 [Candidatus Jorgensenbacteria bacterium]